MHHYRRQFSDADDAYGPPNTPIDTHTGDRMPLELVNVTASQLKEVLRLLGYTGRAVVFQSINEAINKDPDVTFSVLIAKQGSK